MNYFSGSNIHIKNGRKMVAPSTDLYMENKELRLARNNHTMGEVMALDIDDECLHVKCSEVDDFIHNLIKTESLRRRNAQKDKRIKELKSKIDIRIKEPKAAAPPKKDFAKDKEISEKDSAAKEKVEKPPTPADPNFNKSYTEVLYKKKGDVKRISKLIEQANTVTTIKKKPTKMLADEISEVQQEVTSITGDESKVFLSQLTTSNQDQSVMSRSEMKKRFTKLLSNMNSRALEREIPAYKEAFPQLVDSEIMPLKVHKSSFKKLN